MDNRTVAQRLMDMAHALEKKRASLYRVQAYRRAAETVLGLDRALADVVAGEGRKGLAQLPGIGTKLSRKIEALVHDEPIPILTQEEPLVAK